MLQYLFSRRNHLYYHLCQVLHLELAGINQKPFHANFLLFYRISYCFLFPFSESAGEEGRSQLLQEIEFMKQIGSHRNVLSMLGYWVKSEPIMLILEYVPHGDLLQWLRNRRQQVELFRCFSNTKQLSFWREKRVFINHAYILRSYNSLS